MATAVAFAATADAERPVRGKDGVTGVQMIASHFVEPGRLVKPAGQGWQKAELVAPPAPTKFEKVLAGQSVQSALEPATSE
jgi:hypothetical protein